MKDRAYRVGLAGTFDVENFGDLLFPLIAQRELAARLGQVETVPFSYSARPASAWPFEVTSVTELPRLAGSLDAMLLGGGFLVRFDKEVAAGYGPPNAEIHHPTGFWLTPATICLQHGVPILWNAVGVRYQDLPEWAAPLLALALSESAYIAVRDEPSREALQPFANPGRIEIVPDTAFGLGRWLPDPPSFDFNRLRDANGLGGPYILIQGVRGLDGCMRFLAENAASLAGYRFVAVPIGPVNGDDAAHLGTELPGLVRLPAWPRPLLLAELIQEAAAVIGPSYHLTVAALTAGVPVFTPADLRGGKFPGLADYEGLHPLPTAGVHDAEWFLSRLGRGAVAPGVADAVTRMTAHWDRIAAVVDSGPTESAAAVGRFWQSLPGVLEGHAARCRTALDATRSAKTATHDKTESARRIAELTRLLALARGEIAARDRRIQQLLNSTSWKISAPMRFIGRRLGR
jgi:lipopolysaccharide transport system ATP-binding protein